MAPQQYATLPLESLEPSSTSKSVTSSTSDAGATTTHATDSEVPTDTTSSSATPTSSTAVRAQYQHFDKGEYWDPNKANTAITDIPWRDLDGFPFQSLCQPSGNCATECLNTTRLYAGEINDVVEYNNYNFTFFEICSNLGELSLYNNTATGNLADKDLLQISANLGSCLPSTCETSRKPSDCNPACALDKIFDGTVAGHSSANVWGCMVMLCANTCGLPYMDADVMGVGVIASYIIQSGIISCCAVYVLWKTLRSLFASSKRTEKSFPRIDPSTEQIIEPTQLGETSFVRSTISFLVAQCFLGVALQIAVLYSKPWTTDPLTGLGLLFAVIIGFLPPIFTLLLLHTQHAKSWFTWTLTFITWSLSTANLFLLTHQLFTSRSEIAENSTNALENANNITTCGGTSALALCSSVVGRNPLQWVARLYTDSRAGHPPDLKSIYVPWVYSTAIFVVLTVSQWRSRTTTPAAGKYAKLQHNGPRSPFFSDHPNVPYRWASNVGVFGAAFFLFLVFTVFYQGGMLIELHRMDVLDWDGWSFGQIAAVTVWVPVVVGYAHDWLRDWRQ